MVWQGAALPMSCYVVRTTITMSMSQSLVGKPRTLQPLGRCNVTFRRSLQSVQVVMCVQDVE